MDLAEFLRQYAEHHGHRTGSGSQIEVNEMPGSGKVGGSKTRTPLSRPEGTALDQRANSPRPGEGAGGKFTTPEMGGLSPATTTGTGTPSPNYVLGGGGSNGVPASTNDEVGLGIGLAGRKVGELDAGKKKWVDEMMERAKQASGVGVGVGNTGNNSSHNGTSHVVSADRRRGTAEERRWQEMGRTGGTRRVGFITGQQG